MIATLVYIHVLPEFIDAFKAASLKNREHSIHEPGNIRFDLLQMDNDPARFVFYEAYENESAVADHKNTEHYLEWKTKVAHMMAEPREGIRYTEVRR